MKNIVVMCFNETSSDGNENYSISGITQIESILRFSYETIDAIIIYDLGLKEDTIKLLNCYPKVYVKDIPKNYKDNYPHILYPKHYAWKYLITDLASEYGENILYVDSGVILFTNLVNVFKHIQKYNFFISTPWNCKTCEKEYTEKHIKSRCGRNLNNNSARISDLFINKVFFNEQEKDLPHAIGAFTGYVKNTNFHNIVIKKAKELMLDPEIGKSNFKVHMHDQSIISILTHRAGIKMLDFDIIDNNMNNMGKNVQARMIYNNGELLLAGWRQHGQFCTKILNKFYDSYKPELYDNNCNIPKLYAVIFNNITSDNINKFYTNEYYNYDKFYTCLKKNYNETFDKIINPNLRLIIDNDNDNDNIINEIKSLVAHYENIHSIKYEKIFLLT